MEKASQQLIEQSMQYGFAMTILLVMCLSFGFTIYIMWKHQNKREEKLLEVIKENTAAFTAVQGTINTLTQMIRQIK